MKFTGKARKESSEFWEKSLHHPFIQELHAGTLSERNFRYYLLQDRYYLNQLRDIYSLIGQQTTYNQLKEMMVRGSERLITGEIMMRETFFDKLKITEKEIQETPIASTPYQYVSHMSQSLLSGSPHVAFASLLPCAWLYQEIGFQLNKIGSPHPIYQQWIESCITAESVAIVQQEQALLNTIYEETTSKEQQAMVEAFVISTQMEHEFWEMSYYLKN